jgi:hypothetical protein
MVVIAELDRRISELRFIEGVEKVEHVPYQDGDQFWVRFNRPFDLAKVNEIAKKHGYLMVRFAGLPSKLPRGLAEMLWNGVTHVITRNMSGWSRLTSKFGFEPDGVAKLAMDLHGPFRIFIATSEEGIQIVYEYVGVNYVPPAPPPKPVAPTPPKPVAPSPKPAQPATAPTTAPTPTPQKPAETKPVAPQQPAPAAPAAPDSSAKQES